MLKTFLCVLLLLTVDLHYYNKYVISPSHVLVMLDRETQFKNRANIFCYLLVAVVCRVWNVILVRHSLIVLPHPERIEQKQSIFA